MSNVKVTLAIGIALTVAVGVFVLTRSPPRTVRTNGTGPLAGMGVTQGEFSICQENETLPADVSAIRVSLVAFIGANLQVAVYHDGKLLTEGHRNPYWAGTSPTVPVAPLDRATSHVKLCVAFVPNSELIEIFGLRTSERNAAIAFQSKELTPRAPSGPGSLLRGRLAVAYLAGGGSSWWSRAGTVATHMGLGHFTEGKWIALLAAALMAAVGVLTVRVALREQP